MRTPKSKLVRKILNERKGRKLNEKLIKLNESIDKPFETKEEIENWLNEVGVRNFTINDDLTVDVDGDVDLENMGLKVIPIKFGVVKGAFNVSDNNLTSLEGAPKEVGGNFVANDNNLTSLEYFPKEVGGDSILHNNNLTSLKYLPEKLNGGLILFDNDLESLEYTPKYINGDFDISFNNMDVYKEANKLGYEVSVGGDFIYTHGNDISTPPYILANGYV